jgi:3-oxo-5-alpha-steroid 4-dehydrogenase 1
VVFEFGCENPHFYWNFAPLNGTDYGSKTIFPLSLTLFTVLWTVFAVAIVPLQLRISAPYGRHVRGGWGPSIDNRLGWIMMELPALLLVTGFFFAGGPFEKEWPAWAMYLLYAGHYLHRSVVFPLFLRTNGKKMPLAIVASAFFFNLVNASLIGYHLGFGAGYAAAWGSDPRFVAGLALFLLGMGINLHSDYTLIGLRKPGETGYKIPQGGFFRWISCPNHAGEILEWAGFALLTWSLPGLSFAVWTAANLVPRALDHHAWYLRTFPEYPTGRGALWPKHLTGF